MSRRICIAACLTAAATAAGAGHITVIGLFGDYYKPIFSSLRDAGLDVRVEDSLRPAGPWGKGTLDDADLVVALPADYPPQIHKLLGEYVKGGGRIIVVVPDRPVPSMRSLADSFGLILAPAQQVPRDSHGTYTAARGHADLRQWPAASGVRGLFLFSGWRLATPEEPARTLATIADRFSGGTWKPSDVPLAVSRPFGQGRATAVLDFIGTGHIMWDLSGAGLHLFVNMVRSEVGLPPSEKPDGYYARFIPGAQVRIKPVCRILIVPAHYTFPAHPKAIAAALAEHVKQQLGIELSVDVSPPVSPARPSSEYPSADAFYTDTAPRAEADLDRYDLVAVLTSDTLPAFNRVGWSYLGVWLPRSDGGPCGAVIAGGSDQVEAARWDAASHKWIEATRRSSLTLGAKGIVHALMHELGHHLGFPDYVAPAPYIMSGYYRNSRLEYCELFKERLCAAMLSAAEARLDESDTADRQALERLLGIGRRHESHGAYRAGIDVAVRVMRRLQAAAGH